jgi:hypothetical protein
MIRLDRADVAVVLNLIDLPDGLQRQLAAVGSEGINLDDDQAEELLELVAVRLATHGFDVAYEPTSEGVALERLVDRLTVDR